MKNKTFKKTISLILITAGLSSTIAQADIWCKNGTIVQIADVNWGESSIIANYPGSIPADIPAWVFNANIVDMHITDTSTHQYAAGFAGGGGGFGGFSVPGSGQVKVYPYAPHNYITAPSLYSTSEGVKFIIKKCYTIPPMTGHHELRDFPLPWNPISDTPYTPNSIKPMESIEGLAAYWEQSRR